MQPLRRNASLTYYIRDFIQTPDGIECVVGRSDEEDDPTEISQFVPFVNEDGEKLTLNQARIMAEYLAVESLLRASNAIYMCKLWGATELQDCLPLLEPTPFKRS